MNFGSPEKPKTWKDIWGSGQGIGRINNITTVNNVVDQLEHELNEALEKLNKKTRNR